MESFLVAPYLLEAREFYLNASFQLSDPLQSDQNLIEYEKQHWANFLRLCLQVRLFACFRRFYPKFLISEMFSGVFTNPHYFNINNDNVKKL